jgi:hypothetical protein
LKFLRNLCRNHGFSFGNRLEAHGALSGRLIGLGFCRFLEDLMHSISVLLHSNPFLDEFLGLALGGFIERFYNFLKFWVY